MTPSFTIPTFDTDRIRLRGAHPEDLDAIDGFFSSQASRYVGGPRARAESWEAMCAGVGHWALRGFGLWILTAKDSGDVIGVAGLQQPDGWPEAELIWVMFPEYTGQGLATEAVQGIRGFAARELGIKSPISLIYPEYRKVVDMAEAMGATRIEDVIIPDGAVAAWRFPDPEGGTDAG
ncbi:GNAT family N-acetyltransferase [Pseudooceanicola nitratireducens]|jgi:RimJ/RimL family protein N-acetyltransferase|uniref:Protein N-acetyltransferase, RimJ/RimL family n=1 Tax=Pseudooceanicola nitratireducens TaxID=517719 RepID=A0A1I1GXH5_9RHOB|nr:GNAT family N-acetyltransferase [Pseudooceanicola nitratireducens]MEC7298352.1 GNAT family N-acetyltransferase [Pseudomonadota bacterium]MBY6155890.1 GNAT family N-acetyltransferase [Pseudooceanicola nitratireducens]MBY6167285.1 GNAT family N-acetyltransferase [Pseudooceanicola nitratireducens]MEC7792400.1 GNAT family N-acetyltransferase [Pseudomonadota bacterium]MEC8666261.1 GNAT family N-acetyltransferase [Pseudomonadota bacterium]